MKHRIDLKMLLDVIHLWSRIDRNIQVSLWEKNSCLCQENWCTRSLTCTCITSFITILHCLLHMQLVDFLFNEVSIVSFSMKQG